ncbi:MAG: O-antigen ligase family protein [Jatrophihabitantaceae bacterium]
MLSHARQMVRPVDIMPVDTVPVDIMPAARRSNGGETAGWLLLVALGIAVLNQGGFYAGAQWYLGCVLATAAVTAALSGRGSQRPAGWSGWLSRSDWSVPAVSGLALGCWGIVDGWLHGSVGSGVRLALLVVALGSVIGICQRLSTSARAQLCWGIVLLGCLTGMLGWYGVAAHSTAFAPSGQGLWRAMGTLGYPNATAVLLAVLVAHTVTWQAHRAPAMPRWPAAAASTALLIGLGATLSRGGVLAAVAGLIGLAALLGIRRVLAVLWAPVLGATLALAGLLPGLASTARPHLVTAAVLLVAGIVSGTWSATVLELARSRIPYPLLVNLGTLSVACGAVLAVLGTGDRQVLHELRQARLTVSSTDRVAAWHAVTDVIARHPITGAGPGLRTLSWSDPHGVLMVFAYAHNEYLQVLAELGVIGLVLMMVCLAGVLRLLWRCRPAAAGGEAAATAIAALVMVAVSALFDFTGHFPAIVLTAAALVGCAVPGSPARR